VISYDDDDDDDDSNNPNANLQISSTFNFENTMIYYLNQQNFLSYSDS